ncbi:hypothetical protein GCM10011415_22210 [Salipiger pallidus]|uniref:Uncharacterized protein n=1 Tax=Salipiger pallidus TaxID=1775170 RepID=A0A8J3EGS8_9RHOB|nr:hypothetical protein [Salipiger pallidus]GGG73464.1 hypothetical protein GCM10011415_22210 [Salipiger pallidus]
MGRYAEAAEFAHLMLFLAGDKAGFITGAYYQIDGGAARRLPDRPPRVERCPDARSRAGPFHDGV